MLTHVSPSLSNGPRCPLTDVVGSVLLYVVTATASPQARNPHATGVGGVGLPVGAKLLPERLEPVQVTALQTPSPQLATRSVRSNEAPGFIGEMLVTATDRSDVLVAKPLAGCATSTIVKPLTATVNESIDELPFGVRFVIVAFTVNG